MSHAYFSIAGLRGGRARHSGHWVACSQIILASLVAVSSGYGHEPDLDNDKQKLLASAAKAWSNVDRWLVEYEAVPAEGTVGIPVHRIMAAQNPGLFYHLSAHYTEEYPWQADPMRQEYFIKNGMACHRWPFNRTYTEGVVHKASDLGGTIEFDFLLMVIPKWPLADYKVPAASDTEVPIIPLNAIQAPGYRLLPRSEVVAGEECAVFDRAGFDRIWVATEKGICVMRRDIKDPITGKTGQRILTDEVKQDANGLWMPVVFRSQFFSEVNGAVAREYRIRILKVVVNDSVPESVFTPIHRAGTLKYDGERYQQVSPGGEDLLLEVVDFMAKYGKIQDASLWQGSYYAWFSSGAMLSFIIATIVSCRSIYGNVEQL